ncbi:hypothetical protein [Aquibacillus rhizosphaerae]|uniref:Lipoprotein YvcA n=1 Tax=Aquibacillus rhizosphaerae TaxID=3051431 RepID=A0ABT7L9U1_9BACI|nr:hypothetical protein [Aquibacillus sp. LR5S19]MDL4842637.1 hypothetical protein [Aquibacillus sp. LR5S19]
MKIKQILPLIIIMVILGGCQLKEAKLPETKAFQDEFTREFMDSTEEVKDGYYLFRSKTEGYTMLFPKNAVISKRSYERNKSPFESITFEDYSKKENYYFKYDVSFTSYGEDSIENSLEILSDSLDYSGDFKKITDENKLIYYAKKKQNFEADNRSRTVYFFLSYIVPKGGSVGIEYTYSASCYDELNSVCDVKPEEEKKALMLMKSVEFIKNE